MGGVWRCGWCVCVGGVGVGCWVCGGLGVWVVWVCVCGCVVETEVGRYGVWGVDCVMGRVVRGTDWEKEEWTIGIARDIECLTMCDGGLL